MFDPSDGPRLFGVPPGADFPRVVAEGLRARLGTMAPEAEARVQIFVNTRRMQRRLGEALADGAPMLLPRIRLVTDLGMSAVPGLAPAVSPLRRRLELTQLISALLDRAPDLAPRTALYDLADSLAGLMEEMHGEGVGPERLEQLDLSEFSGHWQRSLAFIRIAAPFFAPDRPPDMQARQRRAVEWQVAEWQRAVPEHPVIVAGSTGSRGATALLMRAVAGLPQGALILPGYDFDMPDAVWATLSDAMTAEDHPQFRFRRLMDLVGAEPRDVRPWQGAAAPNPARNALVSLTLRPAPVTDQWMVEGPALQDLAGALAGVTLIEAASAREEAQAIALVLRGAAEAGQRAALVTPDRGLARQVTAALDRWGIVPDDSAGRPLALSAPGRFLRLTAEAFCAKVTAQGLLRLLKHPLCASGEDRGTHQLKTRDLELRLRARGPQFPTASDLRRHADANGGLEGWAEWLEQTLFGLDITSRLPLAAHVARHLALAEALADGPGAKGTGGLWRQAAGVEAAKAMQELQREAVHGGILSPRDYADVLTGILMRGEVRETVRSHPGVMIWGTLEARVQGADLVILGGLNDGVWPARPPPDPWMNRRMRLDSGLLLPERQIGLSAHDFQQAIGAPVVVLSRSMRDAEAQTVASRWLNRLTNLLQGLPDQGGHGALAAMRARGRVWCGLARVLDQPEQKVAPSPRPSPRPPVAHRPTGLYVTEITRLIRDPYAVYARHILRLRPLDPLHQPPDARDRGSVLHLILQQFIHRWQAETHAEARRRLLAVTEEVLAREVPWPAARRLWHARIERVADWFLTQEAARGGTPLIYEKTGSVALENPAFVLSARPDRIDRLPDGRLSIIDYKTGTPPGKDAQRHFEKQLLLEAAMAERGGFAALGRGTVADVVYIGLGSTPRAEQTQMEPGLLDQVWGELAALIGHYQQREQGFTARRAMQKVAFAGDYDHLARFGEWDQSTPPTPEDVG